MYCRLPPMVISVASNRAILVNVTKPHGELILRRNMVIKKIPSRKVPFNWKEYVWINYFST